MAITILSRCLAYVAFAGALVAAAIALNDRQYRPTQASSVTPASSSGAGDAEFAHCMAIRAQAVETHAPIIRDAQRQCAPPAGR